MSPAKTPPRPELAALAIADSPERWSALGFEVTDGRVRLGAVELSLGAQGRGITGWTLRNVDAALADGGVDGLVTAATSAPPVDGLVHPNGAIGVDHVVVTTPHFDATAAALQRAGMPFRRIRDSGGGVRQGFRRLGPVILEVVDAPGTPATAFWGLVVVVNDLDGLRRQLDPHLSAIRDAVQPGRHIATLDRGAGLSTRLAFMDPES
ncbi:MAG: hypothetical protein WAK93_13600 [Solirubrobacteraceae bacterium]